MTYEKMILERIESVMRADKGVDTDGFLNVVRSELVLLLGSYMEFDERGMETDLHANDSGGYELNIRIRARTLIPAGKMI